MNLKGTLSFLFLLGTVSAVGQFKNVMVDEGGIERVAAHDPSVAINMRHPENIVIGAAPDLVYYTKDSGASWRRIKLNSPLGVFGSPAVIADEKGGFYYFHLSDRQRGDDSQARDQVVMQSSGDGGETWTEGASIGLNPPKHQTKQRATVDAKGNLFVSWTQFDKYGDPTALCKSSILYSSSKNGKKWTDPVVISQAKGSCNDGDQTPAGAVPAVTADGKVLIAWSNGGNIYLDRSFNGGDMWLSNDIVVTEQVGGWDMQVPGHKRCNGLPVLMTDKSKGHYRGSLYIVWADQRNGEDDTDIWFTRSHNYGDNWSSPARINDDGKGSHQYLPSMAVDAQTGFLYIVYYDRRGHDDLQTDVYLAWSIDGGSSFRNIKISEKPFTPDEDQIFGDYLSIAAHEGIITPVWTRMDGGKTSVWMSLIKHEDLVKTTVAVE